jgi:hypothetical protein
VRGMYFSVASFGKPHALAWIKTGMYKAGAGKGLWIRGRQIGRAGTRDNSSYAPCSTGTK